MITTLQAISGAGYPGVPSWDILGNVIPYIGGGEEEKIETETKKILGTLSNGRVELHPVAVSATTTRVPVQNGHTGSISVGLEQRPPPEAIIDAWNCVQGPAAGARAAVGAAAADRVSARKRTGRSRSLDVNRDGGMTVTRRPAAAVSRVSTTSSSRSATTRFAAPRARRF